MSFVGSNILAGASGQGGGDYEIERSLRFNSGDSAYLNRTPSAAGNRKTFTFSCWVKKSASSASNPKTLFGVYGGSSATSFTFRFDPSTDDTLRVENNFAVGAPGGRTQAVFRDYSGWMHVVLSMDTRESGISTGMKIYVNGVEQSLQNTVWTQDVETLVNSTNAHYIGSQGQANSYFDGYLTEVNFIDGQALAATDFGETDDNGVWQPKEFAGTYGTNGFHLPFSDNSTNAALGTDTSGNSNTWTVNNISATAPGLATANQGFDVVTYTGNGTSQTISSLAFQPDFVWIKERGSTGDNHLFDSVRGATKALRSNVTDAEVTDANELTSFNSDGFSLGSGGDVNANGTTTVAWCWKANGAASSNTDGTITSQVSANTTYGFSIVKFTMGASDVTIGHGLAVEPKFIITKRYSNTGNWITYHASLGKSKYLMLNSTAVAYTDTADAYTSTNSSVFDARAGLIDAGDCISYVWAEVAGFSKFSSYTGNGSGTGPVITGLGFKPKFVIIKESSSSGQSWQIHDAVRGGNKNLQANASAAESTFTSVEFNGDGFSIKTSDNGWNRNGGTYIYAAYAAKPDESVIDSLVDSPSQIATPTDTGAGGEVVGNYATLNPLNIHSGSDTFSNGNLENTVSSGAGISESTISMSSGKYYFESVFSGGQGTGQFAGIRKPGSRNYTDSYIYVGTGTKYINAASGASYGETLSNGDVIGTAFDATNGTLTFYKNGVSQGTAYTGITGTYAFVVGSFTTSPTYIVNFGQRDFAYTAPSGYKALCTSNLPEPTIADGSKYFDTKLYTGNGSTQTISSLNFSPDWTWLKKRSGAADHYLYDQVRGATNRLYSNTTAAESTSSTGLTAFTSDGFSLGNANDVNQSSNTYVSWNWDAGSSTVSNTDGSITSQVRANPSAGFSIVGYTGNATSGTSIGHGLNDAPGFIIFKNRSDTENWFVWHNSFPSPTVNGLYLDLTANVQNFGGTSFNSTLPSSSVITLGNANVVNGSGDNMIAYCFSSVDQYSSVGSYTGNANSDGPFVYTGFRPAFILIKNASLNGSNWIIIDTSRDTYNESDHLLKPNSSNAEQVTTANEVDILSNGFKPRGTDGDTNGSGNTIIYLAVSENPFKTARAR